MSCSRARILLFAGVSTLALTVGAAELRAADLAPQPRPVLKAPPPVVAPVLTMWIEGVAMFTGGSRMNAFNPVGPHVFDCKGCFPVGPDFVGQKPRLGWEVAFGADYRFAGSPWHVSFDFRYGKAKAKNQNFFGQHTSSSDGFYSRSSNQARFTENEDHIVADFMIGRDFGFGGMLGMLGLNQVKFGVRVADLRARQNVQAQHAFFESNNFIFASGAAVNINTRSEFLGVGPRIAAEGIVPLGGAWGVDWGGGLAVLFGKQRFQADVNGVFASGGSNSSGPTASAFTFSGNACTSSIDTGVGTIHPLLGCDTNKAVFNADASVALSYTFTPRAKLSAGVRFDGYWAALRTLNTHFTGDSVGLHNEDRFFWGPFLRLTGQF